MLQECAKQAADEAVAAYVKIKEDQNEEITISQIAKMWGCSKLTISKRIKAHMVPTVKLGRDVAIKRRWLEKIKHHKAI